MNILIRVDASYAIGSGHVYRCRNLAREFVERNCTVIFLMRMLPGNLINIICEEFKVLILPYDMQIIKNDKDNWLGCSEEVDATESFHLIKKSNLGSIDLIVVDNYSISNTWESCILDSMENSYNKRPRLLVVDDLANRKHENADLLTDQNYLGSNTNERYKKLVSQNCKLRLGPSYALLSSDYHLLRKNVKPRNKLKSVLIYVGGNDIHHLNRRILDAINKTKFCIKMHIVVGPQTRVYDDLLEIKDNSKNIKIHTGLDSLANLILESDFAFASGGVNTWERAALGLPSCTIITADNQRKCSQEICSYVGASDLCYDHHISSSKILQIFEMMIFNPERLERLSANLMEICNGRGASKIAEEALKVVDERGD